MLKINHVTFSNNGIKILNNVTLEIAKGECVALLGPNGSGKSTLIDIITGSLNPDEGEVKIWNKAFKKVKKDIGILYEYSPLFNFYKTKELLIYICSIYNIKYSQTSYLRDQLGIDAYENKLIKLLSKGEVRKVAILLTLLHNPSFIILDEATSGLDPFIRDRCWELFKLNNRTVFFSTHNWEEANKNADKIVFFSKGEILKVDSTEAFLSKKYIKTENKIVLHKSKDVDLLPFIQNFEYYENDNDYFVFPNDTDTFMTKNETKISNFSILPIELKDVYFYLLNKKQ